MLAAGGAWNVANVEVLERVCARAAGADIGAIDLSRVTALDTVGAWLLERLARGGTTRAALTGADGAYGDLLDEVRGLNRSEPTDHGSVNPLLEKLDQLGRGSRRLVTDSAGFLHMLGAFSAALFGVVKHPRSFRLTSTVYQLGRVGWQAVPIMALITFLIGAIIAQQGIFHFRRFGAESYVVDMVGILVLREIGVLIVAIMVAGRSGSAYTAEIGAMKMREEIDALSTMGLDPIAVLILPRVLALVVALPVLAFIGSLAALYGGGLIAWLYGGMSPAIFIARLHEAVSVTHFEVGIIKAPFMALVIGLVAAMEGLSVKGSAESLGQQTTASVVKSIFLVIVLDGLFAVFFASIGM
nr:ABC transporter permease [Bradyrhizobium viridifuturi]